MNLFYLNESRSIVAYEDLPTLPVHGGGSRRVRGEEDGSAVEDVGEAGVGAGLITGGSRPGVDEA